MSDIKGILFDKDGTLVDFNATWSAVADFMAMEAVGGDRPAADELLTVAGYDFGAGRFKADSIFAAGTNRDVVELWFPRLSRQEQGAALTRFYEIREVPGLKKKPSTSEALDWIRLLVADDIAPEDLRADAKSALPKLHGALLKNEQDVHLFERLAFMARRQG